MRKVCFLVIGIILISLKSDNKPNILIIGDSISIGYFPFIEKAFEGKAAVVHNPGNAQHTGVGLEKIHEWLGNTKWDIIQFNWGLWDLCYRNPESDNYGHLDKVNGQMTTNLEQYKEQLNAIVKILKTSTNARLIYVTTTYVPENEPGRHKEDAINYNSAAMEVMRGNGIMINDIYSKSISIHQKYCVKNNNVHYTNEGYVEISKLILPILVEEIDKVKRSKY